MSRIKVGKSSGEEVLRRLELYAKFPEALAYEIQRNRKWLHSDKITTLEGQTEFLSLLHNMSRAL